MLIGIYYPTRTPEQPGKTTAGGGDIFISKLMRGINSTPGLKAQFIDREQASSVDLVHIHGFGVPQALAAFEFKNMGKTVVLLPNWWHDPDLQSIRFRMPAQRIPDAIKNSPLLKWNAGRRRKNAFATMREALAAADHVISFSDAEIAHLRETFETDVKRWTKIKLGIEPFFYNADPQPFISEYSLRDFAIYAGRMDDQKNHLNFVKAARRLRKDIPVVIVGRAPDSRRYEMSYQAVREAAGSRVTFIESMPQRQLASAFAAARLYVQPSLFEIPGMASLEAAAAGCRLAMTERGSTREIFSGWSTFFNPLDHRDIVEKIQAAWDSPVPPGQAEYFRDNFTWEASTSAAAAIYKKCL